MTRYILTFAIVLATALAPTRAALADDKPPTPEQMEQAKAAFAEGKALHDQGKLPEAIEKFKESYRLSKRPVLLYNIAFTMDEAKQDLALFYYTKYLKDAPATDSNRAAATERVKVLEQQKLDASLSGPGSGATTPDPVKPDPAKPDPVKPPIDSTPKPVAIKPAGTYHVEDFQHQIVEEAPPGKPLDVTASVPQDSGWSVVLYYRAAGESAFTAKAMKWRYKELVARIPAAKMAGSAIQYYVEAKDQTGAVITRAGKSTSPNLVNIDAAAQPRFYPDITDENGAPTAAETKHQDDDDPLHKGPATEKQEDEPLQPKTEPGTPGEGFRDVGSKKFERTKWIASGATVALLGVSVLMYVQAGDQATALLNDTKTSDSGSACTAPCRTFDSFDSSLQSAGKRDQLIANVTFGVGIAAGVVAGYYWYRELTGKKHNKEVAPGSPESGGATSAATWMFGPLTGDGVTGAAAIGRF